MERKIPLFEHLDDIVNKTLCVKLEDKSYHSRECLNRECDSCGVEKLDLLKEEDVSLQAPKVSWQKFEYVAVGHTQEEKEKRKLQLVRKETSPGAASKAAA